MSWQERCRERGGVPTVFPAKLGQPAGTPACRFGAGPGARYESTESFLEKIGRKVSGVDEAIDRTLGEKAIAVETGIKKATGLDRALPGVIGKLLGVPWWLVLGAIGYAAYRLLEKTVGEE